MNYTLTEHASKVLAERQIPVEWLERALHQPVLREPDPDDASLERRYRPITEFDGRVLRVVVNTSVEPERVLSVSFDRRIEADYESLLQNPQSLLGSSVVLPLFSGIGHRSIG